MKSLILLIFPLLFVSCKKDNEEPALLRKQKELIQGTWNYKSVKYEYYDASRVKVYEEYKFEWLSGLKFSNNNITYSYNGNEPNHTYNYIITLKDGKYILTTYWGDVMQSFTQLYQLDSSNMVWYNEQEIENYRENGVDVLKPASLVKRYYIFTR